MSAPREYRDRAIVLRGRILGEADRIVTFIGLEHGKIDAVAKGARRPRTRFSGRLEIASELNVLCHRGRSLDILSEAELVHAHWEQLVEPTRFGVMAAMLECVESFCELGDPQPDVFLLLQGVLGSLAQSGSPLRLLPRFEIRLLAILGFLAEFDRCVHCNNTLTQQASFVDVEAGGMLCRSCGHGRGAVNLDHVETAQMSALRRPLGSELPAGLAASPRVANLAHRFLLAHLDRRPRSEQALQALLELPGASSEDVGDDDRSRTG